MSTLAPEVAVVPAATVSPTAKYQVLVGALMVQLILGTIYGYSIFWGPLDRVVWPEVVTQARAAEMVAVGTPLVAAMVVTDETAVKKERAVRQQKLTYSFAICLLAFALSMIFAGRLQDIIGPRFTALIGGLLVGIGFLISGQIDSLATSPGSRLVLLWLTIGLLAGIGIGFAYVCPIAALVKWFPQQKGLMSGIAVAGFGMGAYVFSQKTRIGAAGYIESHGIISLFNVHALICLLAVGLGALLLRNPPAGYAAAAKKAAGSGVDLTWRQTLRTGRFYLIWLMFFSGAMAGLMVIGIMKPFAGFQLVAAAEAAKTSLTETLRAELLLKGTAAVGVLALFNAGGRVFWGLVSDRIGRTLSLIIMFSLQGVTLLLLNALDTTTQLAAGAACVGFNFGGCFALFPSLTADLFGSKNIGANYGWVFTSYGVAGVAGIWAGTTALVWFGNYSVAFTFAAIMCFISAVLAIVLRKISARRVTVESGFPVKAA